MITSESIDQLATALSNAQGKMTGASKDKANPFFKSKYADLASVWAACREPLKDNGLSIVQSPSADGAVVSLETLLMHTSGQWVRDIARATAKDDSPQAIGSAITYLRRYALQSFVGIAPEDDDAEAAQGRTKKDEKKEAPAEPKGFSELVKALEAIDGNTTALMTVWKKAPQDLKTFMLSTRGAQWNELKAAAKARD